jgi:hypothetical protein
MPKVSPRILRKAILRLFVKEQCSVESVRKALHTKGVSGKNGLIMRHEIEEHLRHLLRTVNPR